MENNQCKSNVLKINSNSFSQTSIYPLIQFNLISILYLCLSVYLIIIFLVSADACEMGAGGVRGVGGSFFWAHKDCTEYEGFNYGILWLCKIFHLQTSQYQ